METVIHKTQPWAMTGDTDCFLMREGFSIAADGGALDAPVCLPSGSTRENVVDYSFIGLDVERHVIGGTVYRP